MTRALAACCLVGTLGVSGCMGGGEGDTVAQDTGLTPTQLVQCRDWNTASLRERTGTLEALHEFAGGPTGSPAGRGQTLDDDEAFRLFDSWCSRPYAEGFRLYKLYTRAASFKSISE
jgi:hypothetical protein